MGNDIFEDIDLLIILAIVAILLFRLNPFRSRIIERTINSIVRWHNRIKNKKQAFIITGIIALVPVILFLMEINTPNFGEIVEVKERHILSYHTTKIIIGILFLIFVWLYVSEHKHEKSHQKASDVFRKGLKLIESGNTTNRVEGLLLMADLLRQQVFVDDVYSNTRNLNLADANLQNKELSKIDLTGANLSNATLTGADLPDANLSEANLSKADCSQASLHFTNLSQANLSGAIFNNAVLKETNLLQAKNINKAKFDDVIMTDVKMDEPTFNQFKTVLSEQQLSKMKVRTLDIIELGKTIVVTIPEN